MTKDEMTFEIECNKDLIRKMEAYVKVFVASDAGLTNDVLALRAECEEMRAALTLFLKQWNACGPNSDFGRYFSNVRDAAKKAIGDKS
jgi:oligoribonuclease (3'-5' exoribonuclease)